MAPGLQSIALYSQIAVDRAKGCVITDVDGREYLDFIAGVAVGSLGHCHPHYMKRITEQLDTRHLRQLHDRDARQVPGARRRPAARGHHPCAAVLGRCRGGGGGLPPGQVGHQEVRVRRLLGRLSRQDRGRHRPAGRWLSQSPGAVPAGHASVALCQLLSLPVEPRISLLRPCLRRASAQCDQERNPGRSRRHHHGADAGHGGQRHPAGRFRPCGARDRRRVRRAADRRRDPDRLRAHRHHVGQRPVRPEAGHHDLRQGHGRRLPAERPRFLAQEHAGDTLRGSRAAARRASAAIRWPLPRASARSRRSSTRSWWRIRPRWARSC